MKIANVLDVLMDWFHLVMDQLVLSVQLAATHVMLMETVKVV